MPSRKEHLIQSEHNQNLLALLETKGNQFDDWYVTVAFYTALHFFEAILPVVAPKVNSKRKKGLVHEHYDFHADRSIVMRMIFTNIYVPYSSLYNRSRAAKYKKFVTTPVIKSLAKKRLEEITHECRLAIDKLGK